MKKDRITISDHPIPIHSEDYNEKPIKKQFSLTWEDVNVIIKKKKKNITVLDNLYGYVRSGECLAIMGESGSGKSTLLNVLSNRLISTKKIIIAGDIKINRRNLSWKKHHNAIGFVIQKDVLLEDMKVSELFHFVVNMSYNNLSNTEKQQKIDSTIQELNLSKIENNMIGGIT